MKKLILAAAVIFAFSFSSCTKENVQPHKASSLADKANLAQCDYTNPNSNCTPPPIDGDGDGN